MSGTSNNVPGRGSCGFGVGGRGRGRGSKSEKYNTGMGTLYTSNKKFRCVKAATSDVCSRLLSFLEAIKIIK